MNEETAKPANRTRKSDPPSPRKFDLDQHLPYRIAVVSNLLALSRDASIRNLTDLPLRELRVLIDVGSYEPVKATDIARRSRKDSISVSRAVKRLLAAGLIARTADPADRRSPWWSLTPGGQALFEELAEALEARADEISSVLTEREKNELVDMLKRLEDAAEAFVADRALEALSGEGDISADHREIIRWRRKTLAEG